MQTHQFLGRQADLMVIFIKMLLGCLDEALQAKVTVYGACKVGKMKVPQYNTFSPMTSDSWFDVLAHRCFPVSSAQELSLSLHSNINFWSATEYNIYPIRLFPEKFHRELKHGYIYIHHAKRIKEQSLFLIAGSSVNMTLNEVWQHAAAGTVSHPLVSEMHEKHQQKLAHSYSSRESTIIEWLIEGKSNYEIGMILGISERAVKYHLHNIYRKLGVSNRSKAVATLVYNGF